MFVNIFGLSVFSILIRPDGWTELFYDKNINGVPILLGYMIGENPSEKNTAYHRRLKF